MNAFLVSTGIVALSEIGDKTQLLALLLAARFRKPAPIILGILIATIANHSIAGALGTWITAVLGPVLLRWATGLSFIGIGLWTLIPDKLDHDATHDPTQKERFGVLGATIVAFFLAEMGDKTQFATITLAARFNTFLPVVAGTTLGMMLADVPAVLLGGRVAQRMPTRLVHAIAAMLFIALGLLALVGPAAPF